MTHAWPNLMPGDKVGFRCPMKLTARDVNGETQNKGAWDIKCQDSGVIARAYYYDGTPLAHDYLVQVQRVTWLEPRYFIFPAGALKLRGDAQRNSDFHSALRTIRTNYGQEVSRAHRTPSPNAAAQTITAEELRSELPAPKRIFDVLTPGWFTVIVPDGASNSQAFACEYPSREQAEHFAELQSQQNDARHYCVVECVSRLGPIPPPPPAPKTEWVR